MWLSISIIRRKYCILQFGAIPCRGGLGPRYVTWFGNFWNFDRFNHRDRLELRIFNSILNFIHERFRACFRRGVCFVTSRRIFIFRLELFICRDNLRPRKWWIDNFWKFFCSLNAGVEYWRERTLWGFQNKITFRITFDTTQTISIISNWMVFFDNIEKTC